MVSDFALLLPFALPLPLPPCPPCTCVLVLLRWAPLARQGLSIFSFGPPSPTAPVFPADWVLPPGAVVRRAGIPGRRPPVSTSALMARSLRDLHSVPDAIPESGVEPPFPWTMPG